MRSVLCLSHKLEWCYDDHITNIAMTLTKTPKNGSWGQGMVGSREYLDTWEKKHTVNVDFEIFGMFEGSIIWIYPGLGVG